MEDQVWIQAASKLIEVLQDTRSKLDESRPASVTDKTVSVESKSGDAEAPQASSDPDDDTKSAQGAETHDLSKRLDEDDEESHDTAEENVLSNTFLHEVCLTGFCDICMFVLYTMFKSTVRTKHQKAKSTKNQETV